MPHHHQAPTTRPVPPARVTNTSDEIWQYKGMPPQNEDNEEILVDRMEVGVAQAASVVLYTLVQTQCMHTLGACYLSILCQQLSTVAAEGSEQRAQA